MRIFLRIFFILVFIAPLQMKAMTVGETVVLPGRAPFTWTAQMDSLYKVTKHQWGNIRCHTYRKLCDEVCAQGENFTALEWMDRYVAEAKTQGNTREIVSALQYRLDKLYDFGWDKEFFSSVDDCLDYMYHYGYLHEYYLIFTQKIAFLLNIGRMSAAMDDGDKMLEDARKHQDQLGIALALDAQARAFLSFGDLNNAYHRVKAGLVALDKSSHDVKSFLQLNQDLMIVLKSMGDERMLRKRALIADAMYRQNHTVLAYASRAWLFLAEINLNHHQLKSGKYYLDEAINSAEVPELQYLPLLVDYHNKNKEYALALSLCDRLDSLLGDSRDDGKITALSMRASILYNLKKYKESAECYKLTRDMQVEAYNKRIQLTMEQYNNMYQMAKHESENNHRLVQYLLFSGVVICSCLFFILVARYRISRNQKRQNKQLKIALDHAKESDNMKTSFIQHVSHEIRTPINIITGYAQILSTSDYQLDEATRKQMMTDLDKQTQEIVGSVNELLELSEAESRQYYAHNDKVQLNILCQALLDEQKLRTDKPLEMLARLGSPRNLIVHTNEDALKKVIRHLLQNAIKFTDQGQVTLSTRVMSDSIQIIVEDTGMGIPAKYQEKVFEKFFKINTFKQGMGLGLTVARHIARLMGGDLVIDPAYTGGSRFVFTLKREEED